MDVRLLPARIKDLAGFLAFDRVQPRALPCAVEEREPLIRVRSLRDVVVPNFGFLAGSRVNGALADVADDAETEALWWNEDRHLLRDQLRDEMGRDAADHVGAGTVLMLVKFRLRTLVRPLRCFPLMWCTSRTIHSKLRACNSTDKRIPGRSS